MICPHCEGTGRGGPAFVTRTNGRCGYEAEIGCYDCYSTGTVPDDYLERCEEGRKMRADRVARGLTMGDEARRLGIRVRELSDMERGRRVPKMGELA